jgi:stress-induced morphogen
VRVQTEIESTLQQQLSPTLLQVINESAMHSVPKNSETHFKVVVVSTAFSGRSAVERHRQVYEALAPLLRSGVHALTITARTPEEWAATPTVAASPPCLGGSKVTG